MKNLSGIFQAMVEHFRLSFYEQIFKMLYLDSLNHKEGYSKSDHEHKHYF